MISLEILNGKFNPIEILNGKLHFLEPMFGIKVDIS